MQIQATGLTLFDYLADSDKADKALENAVTSQKNSIGSELSNIESSLQSGQIDDTLKRLQSGEGGISLQTLDNMIAFNLRPIQKDLADMASRLGIDETLDVKLIDGKWQIESDETTATTDQLQYYLDHNPGLTAKLDKLNGLSEFYELGQSQKYALQLKEAGLEEKQLVNYLTNSRESIFTIDSFQISSKDVQLLSRGEAARLFEQAKTDFGLSEES
jgi:hypothetical protein